MFSKTKKKNNEKKTTILFVPRKSSEWENKKSWCEQKTNLFNWVFETPVGEAIWRIEWMLLSRGWAVLWFILHFWWRWAGSLFRSWRRGGINWERVRSDSHPLLLKSQALLSEKLQPIAFVILTAVLAINHLLIFIIFPSGCRSSVHLLVVLSVLDRFYTTLGRNSGLRPLAVLQHLFSGAIAEVFWVYWYSLGTGRSHDGMLSSQLLGIQDVGFAQVSLFSFHVQFRLLLPLELLHDGLQFNTGHRTKSRLRERSCQTTILR